MLQRSSVQVVPVVHVHTHVQVQRTGKKIYEGTVCVFTFYSVQTVHVLYPVRVLAVLLV